jgi:hypothetical protein
VKDLKTKAKKEEADLLPGKPEDYPYAIERYFSKPVYLKGRQSITHFLEHLARHRFPLDHLLELDQMQVHQL